MGTIPCTTRYRVGLNLIKEQESIVRCRRGWRLDGREHRDYRE